MARRRRRFVAPSEPPAPGRLTRRSLLRGLVGTGAALSLSGLLAACGGDDDEDDTNPAATPEPAGEPEATATSEPETEPTTTPASEAEPTATTAPEMTATAEAATRSVDTPFGPVEVPANPQRVVALGEEFMLAELLDLGVTPIASTSSLPDGFYALDEFDTDEIERLSNTEPDIERVVALQPDMLITYMGFAESAGIDLLTQLAPTVAIDSSDYRDAYTSIAAAFGLEARAAERLAEYDSTAEEYGEELGAGERTASVATIYPGATDITLWLGGSADLPQALLDMGFALEPNTDMLEPTGSLNRAFISLEQVDLLAGGDLFMMQSANVEGESETLAELTATDLWQRIPAVEAGRVHIFDRLGYPGVAGRIRILDDIRTALS